MNELAGMYNDTVFVIQKDGTRSKPIKAVVGGGKICTANAEVEIADGDTIERKVGSSTETWIVIDCGYSPGHGAIIPPFYNAKVRKSTAPTPAPRSVTYNTHFNAPANNTQIGENNRIEINTAVENIAAIINASTASPEKKAEAKGIIAKAFQSEAVASIIGAMTKGAVDSLTKPD